MRAFDKFCMSELFNLSLITGHKVLDHGLVLFKAATLVTDLSHKYYSCPSPQLPFGVEEEGGGGGSYIIVKCIFDNNAGKILFILVGTVEKRVGTVERRVRTVVKRVD